MLLSVTFCVMGPGILTRGSQGMNKRQIQKHSYSEVEIRQGLFYSYCSNLEPHHVYYMKHREGELSSCGRRSL